MKYPQRKTTNLYWFEQSVSRNSGKRGGRIILTFLYGGNSILAYFFRPAVTRGETLTRGGFSGGKFYTGGYSMLQHRDECPGN